MKIEEGQLYQCRIASENGGIIIGLGFKDEKNEMWIKYLDPQGEYKYDKPIDGQWKLKSDIKVVAAM